MQVTVLSEVAPFYTSPTASAEAGEGKIKGKTGVQDELCIWHTGAVVMCFLVPAIPAT